MGIFALDERSQETFAQQPEIRMDMQVGVDGNKTFYLVLGSRLVIHFVESIRERMRALRELFETPGERFDAKWEDWTKANSLPLRPVLQEDDVVDALHTIFTGFPAPPRQPPSAPAPPMPPPARPAYVYGHLPFQKSTDKDDVFYRYESFPTSLRLLQTPQPNAPHGGIAPGTYAAPASELPFMPTGLSAVARQALPSLMPARWRWELQPVHRTSILYGTSVPLYGQSGGGVEVRFDHAPLTPSRGPIANPVVLPVL